jgi:hypothetical protein
MRRFLKFIPVFLAVILACRFPGLPASLPTEPIQPTTTNVEATVILTVYFTNIPRYDIGTEPYETAVMRTIPVPASMPEAVLTQLFLGPSDAEKAQGLAVVLSGTTGFSQLTISDGTARIYLRGTCNSKGAAYTIANLIGVNLKQFPEIQWIKIYDQNGETESPDGQRDSIPFCLEP